MPASSPPSPLREIRRRHAAEYQQALLEAAEPICAAILAVPAEATVDVREAVYRTICRDCWSRLTRGECTHCGRNDR